MSALLFDVTLCAMLVGTALLAVGGRALFAAIACFVAYGVLVAVAWVRLGAVDVALVEIAIGAGLTGVLLIGAWSALRRRGVPDAAPAAPLLPRVGAACAAAGLAALLGLAAWSLPGEDWPGLGEAVARAGERAGTAQPVTAVLLNLRAFDTMMESAVLLLALVAVWVLVPADAWGDVPGLRQHARADGVLATLGRLLPPLGLVVAVYVVWVGSYRPGGDFQGGTILAAVGLLVVLAGLRPMPRATAASTRAALVAGPAVFLAVGVAGLATTGHLMGLAPASAGALIVLIEFALALSIAVALGLLVAGNPRERAGV